MLILLPPSEGKAAPGRGRPLDLDALSFPTLAPARWRALSTLIELCDGNEAGRAADALGLGPTQLDLVRRNAELRTTPTSRADRIYTGVLYEALDLAGLSAAARRRSATWLGIVSSLFGLVRPGDRIPAYRLSGDATLPGLGPVATFWRAHLGDAVTEALGSGLLVDLRSTTYAAFWRPAPELAPRVATVRVLHETGGVRKVVSHFNKATKGRLVGAVLEDGGRPRTPTAFASQLRDLGWQVEEGMPTKKGTQLDVIVTEV